MLDKIHCVNAAIKGQAAIGLQVGERDRQAAALVGGMVTAADCVQFGVVLGWCNMNADRNLTNSMQCCCIPCLVTMDAQACPLSRHATLTSVAPASVEKIQNELSYFLHPKSVSVIPVFDAHRHVMEMMEQHVLSTNPMLTRLF